MSDPIPQMQPAARPEPLLVMRDIVKTFPGVLALDGASLVVGRGEVHAVVGQNGAGKSTLMKILNGAHRRDAGEVTLDGKPVDFGSPQAAALAGVSTIFQEINLVPYRSVAENVFMGREPRRFGLLDRQRMVRETREILDRLGVRVDPRRPLGELTIALQQMVAIARAVSFEAKLVIMDEPTSSLDDRETETLFTVIRGLQARGVSVIFITHRLDELYAICDRVTIMRDGRTVEDRPMTDVSRLDLVAKMLGKEIGEVSRGATGFRDRIPPPALAGKPPVIEIRDAARAPRLKGASVAVRPGEIVGLAGLLGAGRTELARIAFGADKPDAGEVLIDGAKTKLDSPRDAIRAGFGLCSEDRKVDGIIPWMSVRENLTLAALPALSRHGVVDKAKQAEIVDRFIARLGIKTAGPEQRIRELSGGNQQKVLLARWLCLDPKLLLLDEPTRGIDVGAKAEIQGLIDELADGGLGVLMISSEIEEIVEGSNRVVVLRDGRTVAEFDRAAITQDAVIGAMAHGDGEGHAGTPDGAPIVAAEGS